MKWFPIILFVVWFIFDTSVQINKPCKYPLGNKCFVTYCSTNDPIIENGVVKFTPSPILKGGMDEVILSLPFTIKRHGGIHDCD